MMETFRETHPYDPLFPFRLMYRKMWHYYAPQVFHFHEWYEMVYVHSGEGVFFINKTLYEMREGELFIVPGELLHHTNPSRQKPYLVTVILFDPKLIHQIQLGEPYFYLYSYERSRQTDQFRVRLNEDRRQEFEKLLGRMAETMEEGGRGHRHKVLNYLHLALSELNDAYVLPPEDRTMSKSKAWLREVLIYIDDHLTEELTLKRLASEALVTPEHFSRVFKDMTGMHVPAYINLKRIVKARGMMTDRNCSIPFISDACGFQSLSHFYRTFRKHFHMTPGEYLNQLDAKTDAGEIE